MSTRTQTSSNPFSKLSLVAKGVQSPPLHARNKRSAGDDDYIPYNGPYEEPPRPRKARNRDSWGDPLYDEDGNNMIQELHQHYVSPDQRQYPWHDEDEERKSRPRARTHSGVSGQTVSSGAVDPHRASVGVGGVLRKASHQANIAHAAGGVGESPAPPPSRFSKEVAVPKRSSLASIFTFGQKKLPLSPAKIALPTSPPATGPPAAKYPRPFTTQLQQRPNPGPPSIYSVSSDRHQTDTYISQEGDAYHSYYNYTPAADQFGHLATPHNATSPHMHPYAYNQPNPEPPQTAPLIISPKLKFTTTQPPYRHALAPPQQQPQQSQEALASAPRILRALKSYASTPNLRDSSRSPNRLKKPLAPKGRDRWLSAETWCDAVMLPRPRLKIEDAQQLLRGRIVSPPGSPVFGGHQNPDRPEGVASRVLAHSRSMASLKTGAEAGPSRQRDDHVAFRGAMPTAHEPPKLVLPPSVERPPRPKSFAWDDLALPSPVPSLARVLEEGQILEHQRKKWQMQATGSLSRSRTKSLGKGGRSNVEYLAARSIVGNQDAVPVLPRRFHARSASQSGTTTNGTTTFNSRTSHSHSNSLVKTTSKSSLSQEHSHTDSWTRTAIKKASALCYDDNLSPADEKAAGLETAIRGGGTKVIRLADPAQLPVEPLNVLSPRNGISPAPSGTSDAHVGIAISTPPPNDSSEHDSIHLPSHPYAQGGVSLSNYHKATSVSKGADYAGPHPAVPVVLPDPNDFSARHRLPPQASLTYHPYASPSSRRESYQVVPRADSDVPPHSKMWAQVSPGIVREILPGEIMYSPFMSERSRSPEDDREERDREEYDTYERYRKSTVTILDTVGLGETLAHAVEEENSQRDSGLGTSEDHPTNEEAEAEEEWVDDGQAAAVQAHHPYRIHRKPVQYDISLSRPSYSTPKKSEISGASRSSNAKDTNHTATSSPVDPTVSHEHQLTPPTPPLPSNYHQSDSSSPVQHSAASSPPRSPPPVGSVDDLDQFRDLFYKPHLTDEVVNNLSRPASGRQPSITWDMASTKASTTRTQRTRTGSGLTTLARQLSQEFEELRVMRQQTRSESLDSESSISRFSRFPTENDIQFVFADSRSDMLRSIGEQVQSDPSSEAMLAFHPSNHLPEDVVSSRASSPGIEGTFRVGSVEAVTTPPATSATHRLSFTGQLSLQPPNSADPTRSSYMTESSISRISNLSDFPVPPSQPAHMSVLSSYFHGRELANEREGTGESQSISTFKPRIGERF
ncbi:hypothetical protein B0H12DRAFT_1134986 [Mycena haematopus]|nr:hypothetical protein B0H12DRAFT_1134986 [Mycena haematopus]